MRSDGRSQPELLVCYRAALGAVRDARQWQHVATLLDHAHADRVALDAPCYELALDAIAGAPRACQAAVSLLRRMERAEVRPPNSGHFKQKAQEIAATTKPS